LADRPVGDPEPLSGLLVRITVINDEFRGLQSELLVIPFVASHDELLFENPEPLYLALNVRHSFSTTLHPAVINSRRMTRRMLFLLLILNHRPRLLVQDFTFN